VLHDLARLNVAEFGLDVAKDGSFYGTGKSLNEVPPTLLKALRSVGVRKPSPMLAAFPENTPLLLSTDARLVGQLLASSVSGVASVTDPGPSTAELGKAFEQALGVHRRCLMRSQDLVVASGAVKDFTAAGAPKDAGRKPGAPSTSAPTSPDGSYVALGIADADGACHEALSALLGVRPERSRVAAKTAAKSSSSTKTGANASAVEASSEPVLSLRGSVVLERRIRRATWLIYASERAAATTVAEAIEKQASQRHIEFEQASAGVVFRARALEEPPKSPLSRQRERFSTFVTVHVGLEGNRLAFTLRSTPDAARNLLVTVLQGLGESEQSRMAAEAFQAACWLGSGPSCNGAGIALVQWKGLTDPPRAERFFEKGCLADHGMSCVNWGNVLKPKNGEAARKAYERGCAFEDPVACAWLGDTLLNSDKTEDRAKATAKLSMACEKKIGFACSDLGYQYREGRGVPVDSAKGVTYLEQACQLDNGPGCVLLGHVYVRADASVSDVEKGRKYYERACELETAVGCHFAGMTLLGGHGVPRNEPLARRYLGRACDAGQAESCRVLAVLMGEKVQ
jgi:TPR repeat protein